MTKVTAHAPIQKPTVQSAHLSKPHKTASGNCFTVGVQGSHIDSNGNKSIEIKVHYDDTKGLFKGANEVWANLQGNIQKTGNPKTQQGGASAGGVEATSTGLKRTGPNSFDGVINFPLETINGKADEKLTKAKLSFAVLKDNGFTGAKWDGKAFQEYTVPLKAH